MLKKSSPKSSLVQKIIQFIGIILAIGILIVGDWLMDSCGDDQVYGQGGSACSPFRRLYDIVK
jgi:hypothetical protein